MCGLLLWQNNEELSKKLIALLGEKEVEGKIAAYQLQGQELIFAVELAYDSAKNLPREVDELLNDYRHERLKAELAATLILLKQAEATGDTAALDSQMKKCQDISKALNQINN